MENLIKLAEEFLQSHALTEYHSPKWRELVRAIGSERAAKAACAVVEGRYDPVYRSACERFSTHLELTKTDSDKAALADLMATVGKNTTAPNFRAAHDMAIVYLQTLKNRGLEV